MGDSKTETAITITNEDFETFLGAYIDAALWSSTDDTDTPLDRNYDETDLAPSARAAFERECRDFLTHPRVHAILDEIVGTIYDLAFAGHDFWLTRNRHGAGFWDRGLGNDGNDLTELAHAWGEADLYVGDDGRIYQMGDEDSNLDLEKEA